MRGYLLVAVVVGAWSCASAARSDSQLWMSTNATIKLNQRWRLSEDAATRFSSAKHGLYEVEANSLVGYALGKGVTVWAGYTHDPQYAAGKFTVLEQRTREQVTFDDLEPIGPGKLSGRLRAEQRWRDNLAGTGWRLRPYLKYSLPLGSHVSLNLSDETFLDLNTTSFQKKGGIERTRNLVSLSFPLAKKVTAEAGLMHQLVFGQNNVNEQDHIAFLGANLSL